MKVVDLAVDRNLLCANFDGYKLSFDPVPVLRQSFIRDPLRLEPHVNQYSLLHTELFAKHNLLHSDPWARHNCYYMNTKHELVVCSYNEQHGHPREQRVVYTMEQNDHGDGFAPIVGDYNYTMKFISEKYCVICDGMLTYTLLDTGDRVRGTDMWQLVTRAPINSMNVDALGGARGFVLYDARLDIVQERKQISLAAGHVARSNDEHIMQITVSRWCPKAAGEWTYDVCQKLVTKGSIYYCSFEPRAQSLILCSNGELLTEAEHREELAKAAMEALSATAAETSPPVQLHNGDMQRMDSDGYSWAQTDNDLTIYFPLTQRVTRHDVHITYVNKHLQVECHSQVLLDETLHSEVDHDMTSWIATSNELQLFLCKENTELWPQLLATAQFDEPLETEPLPIPNLEDPIEDCDFPLDTANGDIKMVRFNLPTNSITHIIFLGTTPPLFGTTLRAGYPAAFATRQGFDGVVWLQQFQAARPNEWSVRHEGTLNAFGYVQASKEQRKFVDCCPDLDYAVVCESYRHLFIYKQRNDSAAGLRNRNGPQVVIGKQHLITLDDDVGEVLGLVTAPNCITVLTEHAIFFVQV